MQSELDRNLEQVQTALIDRFAPETRIVRLRWSQGETQAYELGAGPPLLYVHGGLGGAFEIVPILSALAQGRRVIAVDRPGHGLADPFDYRGVDFLGHARTFLGDILDALELPSVDVVANSMDGLWSVPFALDAPSRVSRLVLVGAPAGCRRRVPIQLIPFGLPFVGQRLGSFVFSHATRTGSRSFWKQLLVNRPENVDDLLYDFDVANSRRNVESMVTLVKRVASVHRLGLRRELMLAERWARLTTPTLLLWGEDDAFGSPNEVEASVAKNPNLHLVRLADVGHLPWFDDPETILEEIDQFLEPDRGSADDGLFLVHRSSA